MLKIKSKYKQTRLDVERRFVKLSKVSNFEKPLSPIIKKVKSDIITGRFTPDPGNNLFNKTLVGSVGTESTSKISSIKGSDFKHEIGFGYLNNIEHAVDFENGVKEAVTRKKILEWVQSKQHYQSLSLDQQKNIADLVRFKIQTEGSSGQPVLSTAWREMKDDYLREVNNIIHSIWSDSQSTLF